MDHVSLIFNFFSILPLSRIVLLTILFIFRPPFNNAEMECGVITSPQLSELPTKECRWSSSPVVKESKQELSRLVRLLSRREVVLCEVAG